MKKFCLLLLVTIALVACEKENESVVRNTDLQEVVSQNKVSLKQALLHAENSINGISPTTRSAERKVKSTEIYVAKPATRSAEGTEVSFYLINYEDNEGFAMVSTDSRATPVYAYSDEGNLTAEDLETNPALQIFMDGSIEQYQIEVASNIDIYEPIEWPDSSNRDVLKYPIVEYKGGLYYEGETSETITKEKLLTTYWNQGSPYGDDCPNGVGGCGPVAAAQIMAYHKHPAQFGGYVYNWDAMTADSELTSESTGAIDAAKLIHQIGEDAFANYDIGRTGTNIDNMRNTFCNFYYSCESPVSYDINRIIENIDSRQPIYIRGDNGTVGHAWVIDGYSIYNQYTTYYYTYAPYDVFESIATSSTYYYHCNFGWGLVMDQITNNGYYLRSSFEYNNNLRCIYDITPNN